MDGAHQGTLLVVAWAGKISVRRERIVTKYHDKMQGKGTNVAQKGAS